MSNKTSTIGARYRWDQVRAGAALGLLGFTLLAVIPSNAHAQDGSETPPPAAGSSEPVQPAAPASVPNEVAALSPSISDVQIVGPWQVGDDQGVWRSLMLQPGSDTTKSRFFVQQISESGTSPAVVATTEVAEVATLDGTIVGYRADQPAEGDKSGLTLFFDIVPTGGEISETYEFFISPGQPYRFGPASN